MNFTRLPLRARRVTAFTQLELPQARRWPEWAVCLALTSLWFACTSWLRPLAIPDEGRYVGVAWEMLRSGDWLVPTLDGLPFFHKPPLFYWLTAGSMALFGPGVAAARVAAWLAGVTIATGLFAFLARWVGRRPAWTTLVVLATMPLFYGAAQYANMDLLVAACISSAVLLAAHAALSRSAGLAYRHALAWAFVAAALGVLAKGLIGVVLPVLVLMAWALVTRRSGKVLALLTWGPGWLIFIALAAPWFLAVQARFPQFDHYFFMIQHVQRFAAAGFNNTQPWWFYPVALIALTLPWSPWLIAWRPVRQLPQAAAGADVRALMAMWLAVVVLFFSFPTSKPVGYVLPAIAPLASLIADAVVRRFGARDRWLIATVAVAAVGCITATTVAHFLQPKSREAIAEHLSALKRPGEAVFFLDNFYYDVMFYARLDAPVTVVDPWLPAEVAKDSWRRELVDAQQVAPDPRSTHRLLRPAELAPALCAAKSGWLIGAWPASPERPWLARQAPVYQSDSTALWHVDTAEPATRSALNCQ